MENVVWRNKKGDITCPGDKRKKTCDNSCPIYLNTQAILLDMKDKESEALELYLEAVKIAPDFYDAWNKI